MDKTKQLFEVKPGGSLVFGVTKVSDGVQFAVYLPGKKKCTLNLYKVGESKPESVIELTGEFKRGGVFFVTLTKRKGGNNKKPLWQLLSEEYEYTYKADGEEFVDPYAQVVYGRNTWGKRERSKQHLRGGICLQEYDWGNDAPLRIPFSDLILYQLHVRGYTKHGSSGVKNRGTFDGLREKIPYIKDLGINAVMLLPCYEFDEIHKVKIEGRHPSRELLAVSGDMEKKRLNYWGYGASNNYYLAPKTSYASDKKNPSVEFKELIKSFHEAGIEVLLDIYFSPGTNLCLMTDCLRHWILNYHIDGFRINQEVMPTISVLSDPILSGVKILASYWPSDVLRQVGGVSDENVIAEYNEGFQNDARRYLKSDEGMVEAFVKRSMRNPKDYAVVNFMTHVNGFTMMDLVSYDIKHNEENGERGQDGAEYNYSWNCGVEGKTRRKTVQNRRMSQIRNAFCMMMCSQGTPMILAGDEFGNSQLGNNNAYCHDSSLTWLNWKWGKQGEEINDYVKKLIMFRKKHPVLHQKRELLMQDFRGIGIPDLSIHSTQSWRMDYSYYNRMLGILLCGDYVPETDDTIYLAYNMYWEEKNFELPNLPSGKRWHLAFETNEGQFMELPKHRKLTRKQRERIGVERRPQAVVPPRSVKVFVGY